MLYAVRHNALDGKIYQIHNVPHVIYIQMMILSNLPLGKSTLGSLITMQTLDSKISENYHSKAWDNCSQELFMSLYQIWTR